MGSMEMGCLGIDMDHEKVTNKKVIRIKLYSINHLDLILTRPARPLVGGYGAQVC